MKQYHHQHWIYCVTSSLKDPDEFMKKGTYTDLLFLDEATALAAGLRPCGQCNGSRYDAFLEAWASVTPSFSGSPKAIDEVLRHERIDSTRHKRTFPALAKSLPIGTMVRLDGAVFLLAENFAYPWTIRGYGVPVQPPVTDVEVLTPASTVKVLASGLFNVTTANLVMDWT